MHKKMKRKLFEDLGGRAGISERILEIAKEITETDSLKRAIIGAGQIRFLAEACMADTYWDEKEHYGYSTEERIANGSRKVSFDGNGSMIGDK